MTTEGEQQRESVPGFPWSDAADPAPVAFTDKGRWTGEFVEWAKREGKRRAEWVRGHSGSTYGAGE